MQERSIVILIRSLLCATVACGAIWGADQQFGTGDSSFQFVQLQTPSSTLPAPMASAIQRLNKPGALQNFMQRTVAHALIPTQKQCSIPLAEYKIPDNPKFLIRQMPVPKNAPDSMPIIRAAVCPSE